MHLQQQPDGVDRISSPAPSNKSTLIGTDEDNLMETIFNYALKYLHGVAEQVDEAGAFPDRDGKTSSPH